MEDIQFEVHQHIDDVLEAHMLEEDRRFNALQQEIKDMREDIKALTEAWQQARGVVSFMKWVAGISGSLAAFIVFLKDHFR